MTKPTPYASKTQVPVQQSIAEMQKLLQKHGATNITFAWSDNSGGVGCFLRGRLLKFTVSLNRSDPQEMMRRWRCLILVIRGRLVEVQDGISTMDEAFLPYVVVNEQGATVWETIKDTLPAVGAGRHPVLAGR